jgi:N6-L-threonylcarbamoyladenine synthase
MFVLGIETSCDETAIAVVKDGAEVLSNVVASQADVHALHGGVVPELACRRHIDNIIPTLDEALQQSSLSLEEIDLIAVAVAPGLIGALLVGLNLAKGLSLATGIPLIGVNHVEAHLYAAMMDAEVPLPAIGVIASGGHTTLLLIRSLGQYELVGQTKDDAIGEAFDKVACMLGLSYPGGPQIEKLAKKGDPSRFHFKAGQVKTNPLDFSFSGLKTAVLYSLRDHKDEVSMEMKADIAASFQKSAFSDLIAKTTLAARQYQCKSIVLGGGVTANQTLREWFETSSPLPLFWPKKELSVDNGVMIAALAYHQYKRCGADAFDLQPSSSVGW